MEEEMSRGSLLRKRNCSMHGDFVETSCANAKVFGSWHRCRLFFRRVRNFSVFASCSLLFSILIVAKE